MASDQPSATSRRNPGGVTRTGAPAPLGWSLPCERQASDTVSIAIAKTHRPPRASPRREAAAVREGASRLIPTPIRDLSSAAHPFRRCGRVAAGCPAPAPTELEAGGLAPAAYGSGTAAARLLCSGTRPATSRVPDRAEASDGRERPLRPDHRAPRSDEHGQDAPRGRAPPRAPDGDDRASP